MSRLLAPDEAVEFKALLAGYSLHENGLAQFQASSFGIIAGPAGAGKDTLRDGLVAQFPQQYVPILSTTTRPARVGEIDGKTYHFRDVENVKAGLEEREFFQAELVHNQQVSCLHLDEIRKLKPGQTGLSILITQTEQKLHNIKHDIKTVFLIPPDITTLMTRMQSERMLDDSEINRRLEATRTEIEQALDAKHYYCIISDTIPHAVNLAHAYFQEGTQSPQADVEARQVMNRILDTLNDW